MRKPLIAGNWKMFLTASESRLLIEEICKNQYTTTEKDVAIFPNYTCLASVNETIKNEKSNIILGAQNVSPNKEGAYTGEISVPMLVDLGVKMILVGHSERRQYFNETDEIINQKIKSILGYKNITALLCVGENLYERESSIAKEVVISQVGKCLNNIEDISNVVIAYEPVWAIGTGKTASPTHAQHIHLDIRKFIANIYGETQANKLRILYGGSVKPDNIKEIMSMPDIDGVLVGGASLSAQDFNKIINYNKVN